MKHTKVSLIATCTFAAVIILVVLRQTTSPAQATGDQKPGEWKAVEDVFGFPPANLPGRGHRWRFCDDGQRGWTRHEGDARQRGSSRSSAQPCVG
jgi:hypothetical protein